MKIFGGIAFGIGLLLVAGAAGSSDFYEECRAAADCVAGDAPSTLGIVLKSIAGIILLGLGVLAMNSED